MWDREVHVGYNHLSAAKFDIAMTSTIPRGYQICGRFTTPWYFPHKFYLYLILQGTNVKHMFGKLA